MPDEFSLEEIRETLFTAVLSDMLDGLNCPGQVAEPGLVPVIRGTRAVGRARTARAVSVSTVPDAPYDKLLMAVDSLTLGDVLVISMDGKSRSGVFGGLLATAVTASGGSGVIVDGYVRDADEIEGIGLPTFARGTSPLDSAGRDDVVEVGGPVVIAGVLVHEGDVVFADRDGVVFVPAQLEREVLRRAFEHVRSESDVKQALRDGMPVSAAFARFGIL